MVKGYSSKKVACCIRCLNTEGKYDAQNDSSQQNDCEMSLSRPGLGILFLSRAVIVGLCGPCSFCGSTLTLVPCSAKELETMSVSGRGGVPVSTGLSLPALVFTARGPGHSWDRP